MAVPCSLIPASPTRPPSPQVIAAWRDSTDWGRCQLVKSYFVAAGGFSDPQVIRGVELPEGGGQGPLQQLQRWAEGLLRGGSTDPFFAVVAHRTDDPQS